MLTCPLSSLLLQSPLLPLFPCPEQRAAVPMSCPQRDPISPYSPERAPISLYSPKRAPVPTFSPERAPVPKSSQERASAPKGSPESVEDHKCSVRLLHPLWLGNPNPNPTLVFCRPGSTAAFQVHASMVVAGASTSALWIITLAHRLSISASGSSTAVGRPLGVVSSSSSMAPPSVCSTVGCHHGCGLGPAWLLLLQVPPVITLAPPSI
ncbi:hypothetical protein QQF64_003211 [Cirrhinus molitorella]|uniref:Uncharacterized protein n=1 Tax=Cirrhinus molitorella TaxID=172907 RepID=A0ABR3MKT8_9TELE